MVFNKLGGILLEYMIYVLYMYGILYVYSYPQKEEERLETDARSPFLPGNCLRSRALSPGTCATTKIRRAKSRCLPSL
jgi:hypothetical protein